MRNLPILFLFTLLFTACKKQSTTTQSALNAGSSSACIIGKWSDSSLPLNLKMSSDFQADLVGGQNPLEDMANVWNSALSGTKTLITTPFPQAATTGYAATTSFRDSEIGIYKSNLWFTNVQASVIAITQYYGIITSTPGLGQHIQMTHGDIIVNYRDYDSDLTMTGSGPMDLPTVILHEMGHLLGLCHESKEPSIMAPYYVTTQHAIQNFDKKRIQDLYVNNYISGLTNSNTNALSIPEGTEVKGVIELRVDGKCTHYLEGKKTYEHQIDLNKRPNIDLSMFQKKK